MYVKDIFLINFVLADEDEVLNTTETASAVIHKKDCCFFHTISFVSNGVFIFNNSYFYQWLFLLYKIVFKK